MKKEDLALLLSKWSKYPFSEFNLKLNSRSYWGLRTDYVSKDLALALVEKHWEGLSKHNVRLYVGQVSPGEALPERKGGNHSIYVLPEVYTPEIAAISMTGNYKSANESNCLKVRDILLKVHALTPFEVLYADERSLDAKFVGAPSTIDAKKIALLLKSINSDIPFELEDEEINSMILDNQEFQLFWS